MNAQEADAPSAGTSGPRWIDNDRRGRRYGRQVPSILMSLRSFPAPKNQDSRQIHDSLTPLGQFGHRAHLRSTPGPRPGSLRPPVAATRCRQASRRTVAGWTPGGSRPTGLPLWMRADRTTVRHAGACSLALGPPRIEGQPQRAMAACTCGPAALRRWLFSFSSGIGPPDRTEPIRPGPVRLECQTPALIPSFPTSLHCAQADARPSNPRFDRCRGPGNPPAPRRRGAGLPLVVAPDLPGLSLTAASSWR
jgi:hypothetical protein